MSNKLLTNKILDSNNKSGVNPFRQVLKKIRSKRALLSLADITKEVEKVRAKRYDKKA
jgi:hypothetical protein